MRQLPNENPTAQTETLTSHAMLVAWGVFAQRIGLVKALEDVPIRQRQREHTPQAKLIEFLVAILAGCAYLQPVLAREHQSRPTRAWEQKGWADDSGVSRTLKACTEETVTVVREALEAVSRPFIEREVMLALRERGLLVYDGDLTGRPVSNSSTTYFGAAFGWMGDAVHFGYQAAMVSMHSPTYGRLWLSVEQHPGNTISATQAETMVRAAETRTGARPWRRTDLLAQRIEPVLARATSRCAPGSGGEVRPCPSPAGGSPAAPGPGRAGAADVVPAGGGVGGNVPDTKPA